MNRTKKYIQLVKQTHIKRNEEYMDENNSCGQHMKTCNSAVAYKLDETQQTTEQMQKIDNNLPKLSQMHDQENSKNLLNINQQKYKQNNVTLSSPKKKSPQKTTKNIINSKVTINKKQKIYFVQTFGSTHPKIEKLPMPVSENSQQRQVLNIIDIELISVDSQPI